jgi:hypothetical protein
VLSLTVNNFTYAALGTLLNWWDVHPLPAGVPAPYNDASRYGRISAWGYAEVLASTVPEVPAGSHVWGYVPLGTLAQDLEVRPHENNRIADQVFITSAYRQHVMPIYNRYFVYLPASGRGAEIERRTPGVAYDALLRIMHATAFLMESFAFSADPQRVVAPGPGPDDNVANPWTVRDADLAGATVLVFAPGSKVGAAFVSLLRGRKEGRRPRKIVGVSSESSKSFVDGTGIYDAVALTSADPLSVARELGHEGGSGRRLVVFDFGARAGAAGRWAAALASENPDLLFVGIGYEIVDPAKAREPPPAQPPFRAVRVNADDMRRRAMKKIGEEKYWLDEGESWAQLRKDGIRGFGVTWGEGMQDVVKGWDRLARGDVLPSEGLVYKL